MRLDDMTVPEIKESLGAVRDAVKQLLPDDISQFVIVLVGENGQVYTSRTGMSIESELGLYRALVDLFENDSAVDL